MRRNGQTMIFVVVALVAVSAKVSGQRFETRLADTKLPNGRSTSSVFYNGVDNVYLFGG
jgi:hypothetical protein